MTVNKVLDLLVATLALVTMITTLIQGGELSLVAWAFVAFLGYVRLIFICEYVRLTLNG